MWNLKRIMKVKVKLLSRVQLFATLWTVAHQAPLFMGFSRQEYWSGLPFPSPEDLAGPGFEPMSLVSPALQMDSLPLSHWGSPECLLTLVQFIWVNTNKEDCWGVSWWLSR